MSASRVPCDQCRQRRIRCDGMSPCASCQRAQLACCREYIRKRRGPKHGHGKRIQALRAWQSVSGLESARNRMERESLPLSAEGLPQLIELCIRVYVERMYPVMPLFQTPDLIYRLKRPLAPNEYSMLCALSAMVVTFTCGRDGAYLLQGQGMEWRAVAQFLLRKCLAMRLMFAFVDDTSVMTLLASFFVAVSQFELGDSRSSWFYLREAITLAQGLGLDTHPFQDGVENSDGVDLCRIYNILFVTERSLAISRHMPVLLPHALQPPRETSDEAQPDVNAGFAQLVWVYSQIDVAFIDFWRKENAASSSQPWTARDIRLLTECPLLPDTQKADILVTQHWLQHVFWMAALRQGLISRQAEMHSRTFQYPEDLALSLLQVLSNLPSEAVQLHGLGIFEKIFDVANTLADLTDYSARVAGWTQAMAQNLDRLAALQRHLLMTPNSQSKYASFLGSRIAQLYICYGSLSDIANESEYLHTDPVREAQQDGAIALSDLISGSSRMWS
ncbi:hypothetical protein BJX99DRAFT_262027 [Aspergillus californicus]